MNFSLLFKPQMRFDVGTNLRRIVLRDLNQDQHLDLVTTNGDSNTVSVLIGYGNGSFSPQTSFNAGSDPYGIALADLNQDQHLDIVVANGYRSTVSVLIGHGNGSFARQTTFSVGNSPQGIALGDLNQDNRTDIVAANLDSNNVSVLISDGKGSFASQTTFNVGSWPTGVALGDVNQDGFLDIVTSNQGSSNVSVLIGDGNGSFAPQKTFSVGSYPIGIALGDLNQDQRLDIVVANGNSNTVSVLIGDGNGNFEAQITFNVEPSPGEIVLNDLNQDQLLDIVSSSTDDGITTISISLGNPDAYTHSPTLSSTSTLTTIPVHSTTTQTLSFTQTTLIYNRLLPINHIYSPQGPISIISQFDPEKDKIDLTAYSGVTYPDLHFQQVGNNTDIRFIYRATFLFSISTSPGQPITTNNFLCAPSAKAHSWLVQASTLIPTNGTVLTQFDPHQDQIDLRGYNISCQSIQIQVIYNLTVIQFNYPQQAQITVVNTNASHFKQSDFIFSNQPSETSIDKIIGWAKVLVGPVASGLSSIIGLYLKRGLIQNILYASDCWKGNRYIKDEVWAPEDEDERRQLWDRHGESIAMRDVDIIKIFTVFKEEPPSLLTRILPNYYALRRQSELIDQKLVITKAISNKAWIQLNSGALDQKEIHSFFIQVIAKSGAIVEQLECSLENLHSEYGAFSLDMSGAPVEEASATASGSEKASSFDADQSKTVLSSVYCVQIQWSNPILQNYPLLQWAHHVGGPAGVDRLIEIGTDSHRYGEFEHLEQMMGTQKALEWMLESDAKPVSTVGSSSAHPLPSSNLFWVGMIAYRLPVAYDQTKYLLKTVGLDLDEFYENQDLTTFVNPIGSILRPSLLLGGATLAYCTSSDPLVLLVAANQPGFSSNSDLLANGIHYLTTIFSFARAYASPSAYTLPLVALQGTNLVSHLLVDTGLVAEDHHLMQWMQSATGLVTETLGLFLYPDLPIKVLQGISLLAQGLHCAKLAWENIASYRLLYTETNENLDIPQTEDIQLQEDTLF